MHDLGSVFQKQNHPHYFHKRRFKKIMKVKNGGKSVGQGGKGLIILEKVY